MVIYNGHSISVNQVITIGILTFIYRENTLVPIYPNAIGLHTLELAAGI